MKTQGIRSTPFLLTTTAAALVLALAASPALAHGGGGGGGGGGMGASGGGGMGASSGTRSGASMGGDFDAQTRSHISAQGLVNTNGPNASDRDTGTMRAEDRASANGLKHGHRNAKGSVHATADADMDSH